MSDVVYLWDPKVSTFHYGDASHHPMKPLRLRMVHELLTNYGVLDHVRVVAPPPVPTSVLTSYHCKPYVDFLRSANCGECSVAHSHVFQFSSDCPPFEGVYDFSSTAAAGSVAGAILLNHRKAEVAVNWSGGLHHAKRMEPSGFCYINDIVLAIFELLKTYRRVLYVDIDVHHGDGVEEALYCSDRVMTLSIHKGDNFFPGTGKKEDIGVHAGRGFSVNVPLFDGITDDQYFFLIFKPLVKEIMASFQPSVVVMQCGADSLVGDRLGTFNISSACHTRCVEFVRSFRCPMLVLGGGGYTMTNVAKTWTMETAMLCGKPLDEDSPVPEHVFSNLYGTGSTLGIRSEACRKNENTFSYIEKLTQFYTEQLRRVGCPNVSDDDKWLSEDMFRVDDILPPQT